MALTIHGYRVSKTDIPNLTKIKTALTVRPYVPAVFVKPQYVPKYPVFKESEKYMYVPKHYGIQEYGPYAASTRDVPQTDPKYWEFAGSIRAAQQPVVDSFLKPEPHDGIISLQTGGGKTVCALYIASQLRVPAIVLVNSTFLRDQWIDRIKAFLPNARIGLWNEDESVDTMIEDIIIRTYPDGSVKYKANDTPNFKLIKNLKKHELNQISTILNTPPDINSILSKIPEYTSQRDIVVGMLQGIIRDNVNTSSFTSIGFVIVDECHHIASEAFIRAIPKLTSKYMLGLSATPERKDKLMYVINWCLGPILYKSDAADKVDDKVKVQVIEFETDDVKFNEIIYNHAGVMFTSLMVNKLAEFEPRNKMLIELLEDVYEEKGRQILVLSDRVEHTKTLLQMLPEHIQKETGILSSGMKPAVRDEFCKSKRILISTYQLVKEGFDVASLNTLLMATSRPDVVQIVGRILRTEKHTREVQPLILDVVDTAFRRQFHERIKLYRERNYIMEKVNMK
jgi:superfamily II DNA or RNA helicase